MITIIVPTKNRPDFVIRLLNYYESVRFQGVVRIADSSDPEPARVIQEAIRSRAAFLQACYTAYSTDISVGEVLNREARQVKTSYVVFHGDDDFLIPQTLIKAEQYLDHHSDYTAVTGLSLIFELPGPYGKIPALGVYRQRAIEADSASQRLLDYLNAYFVPLFAVHRTPSFQAMLEGTDAFELRHFSDEYLPGCRSVILGKIRKLDDLYLIRQLHPKRTFHKDLFDMFTHRAFGTCYELFRDRLTDTLSRVEALGAAESSNIIRRGFWNLWQQMLQDHYHRHFHEPPANWRERVRQWGAIYPRVYNKVQLVTRYIRDSLNPISLRSLKKPRSRHYHDFEAVLAIIEQASAQTHAISSGPNSSSKEAISVGLTQTSSNARMFNT